MLKSGIFLILAFISLLTSIYWFYQYFTDPDVPFALLTAIVPLILAITLFIIFGKNLFKKNSNDRRKLR